MMNRIKYKLSENKSAGQLNQDSFTQVSFSGERRLLPVGEINHIVDVGEEFARERNKSSLYRLKGTVSPIFSNPLMNTSGGSTVSKYNNGLDIFNKPVFLKDQTSSDAVAAPGTFSNEIGAADLNYKESFNLYLEEKDGWFGYYDPDIRNAAFCEYFDMEPTRERFDLNSSTGDNWKLTVTYPYASDDTHHVVVGGLLITSAVSVVVGGRPMIAFSTATHHGLENGDRITISGMTNSIHDGSHTVKRLGLDNGDHQDNFFVLDFDPLLATISPSVTGRMRKLVSNEPSTYYLRKFKKILVNNDYEMYPLAFSKTIYNDLNYQFIINEDIDVEGLKDNLGRPLSELYVTIIKGSSSVFGNVQSGLDLELFAGNLSDDKLSNVRRLHDGPSVASPPITTFNSHIHLPNEGNLYNNFNSKQWFYGDVVEYNRFTVKETKLANVMHRFNTTNRENANTSTDAKGPRREGYLYNPHHLVKIREFSLYVEQGDENTGGIPDYAEYLGVNDGRYLWRDFLDIGIWDGEGDFLDYPFTNGAHYLHQNFCFMTTRQDPFGNYNLYYEGDTLGTPFDPPDPRGDALTDKFIVKNSPDVC